jgi:iron-sulfur cluster assembly accessory protein
LVYTSKEIAVNQKIYSNAPETVATGKPQSDMNIHLTEAAIGEIRRRLAQESDSKKNMLRLKVGAGGCSGLSYEMEFVAAADAKDREFVFDGLSVLVDARSLAYVAGMTLDYSAQMVNGGFQFSNPKAKRSCGCGTSFSV